MIAWLAQYSKLVVAAVGLLAVVLGPDVLGITSDAEATVQQILGILTLLGVYGIPNKPVA